MKTIEQLFNKTLKDTIRDLQRENSKLKKKLEKYKDLEKQVVTKLGRNNIYNIKLK
jgi:UDP-galactopyranose mutase